MQAAAPLIVDIKRHSLEDGPGIRSVVFFKGCPLRCIFCHNPETQDPTAEIAFSATACIRCGRCAEVCPHGAIDLSLPGRIRRERCRRCGTCAVACPGQGLRRIGSHYPVEALAEILARDLPFYRHSGGGVTLSGGEPTLHPDYLEALLSALKARGIHLALQTCGHFDYTVFERKILPYLDLVYLDIKFADPDLHRRYTGRTNHTILANLSRLLQQSHIEVRLRVPLIPGITATRKNLSGIAEILCRVQARSVSLLPYNPLGAGMAESLGRHQPPLPRRFMTPDEEEEIRRMFTRMVNNRQATILASP